jgi:hypothetical protein
MKIDWQQIQDDLRAAFTGTAIAFERFSRTFADLVVTWTKSPAGRVALKRLRGGARYRRRYERRRA